MSMKTMKTLFLSKVVTLWCSSGAVSHHIARGLESPNQSARSFCRAAGSRVLPTSFSKLLPSSFLPHVSPRPRAESSKPWALDPKPDP